MLKRKIYDDLMKWKARDDKMCLLIKGARQVGKTFIIEQFARENYKHFTAIDFVKNPAYKTIFNGDLDTETLIKQISLRVPGVQHGIKLSIKNVGGTEEFDSLPLYMAIFL